MADTYFKIAAVAALPATGKTSLITRFTTNDFNWLTGPTIGQYFKVHYVSVDNTRVKLQIWDMSSLRICRYMLSKILINCKGVILTYDISDKDSFLSANEMITIIKEHSEEAISIFVGLKCDLRDKREVPFWYAKKFADKHNMKYMETSAKTGENVVEVFVSLAEDLIYREKNKESQSSDEDEKATRLSRLPQMSHEKVDEELGLLGLETTEDLQEIMKLGTYRSYGNRIFLVGQFSVGKTTLSKVLIGEGLPKQRGATDGIGIHIGKAGMSLDDKKWLSFHTGSTNLDIVAGMLMSLQRQNSEGMHHGEQCLYSVESIKEVEKVIGIVNKIPKEAQTIQPSSEIPVIEERHAKSSVLPKTVKPTSYDNPNIQLQFSKLLSSNIPQWKLKDLIFKAIKEGKYKQNIVFFDIWDFAGQKEFYMTHQLFMTSRGIFVLMFNACHSLRLENDSSIASHQEPSAAVYLVHWVNSILTYCKKSREGFPRILLVATHKDRIQKDKIESCRAKLIESLYQLFKSHAGLAHLEYKPLIFINATDINDREIDLLRQCLIERASDHPRWGEEMPTAWIPLELQIAEQVELGNHIISKQQLEDLNSNNQSMVLSEKQINTFLKVQHSLGKLLYFDEVNLRDYIIINPVFLVEVLRSIITDKQFWPKEEKLLKIFWCLVETGTLERNDMYALWNQKEFVHIVPYREFMTDILVYPGHTCCPT